jgi:serine/threonine protein kinase
VPASDPPYVSGPKISTVTQVDGFNSNGYPVSIQNYKIANRIGSGSFGDVFRAKCTMRTGKWENVALKIIDLDKADLDALSREVMLLATLRHENVAGHLASFTQEHNLVIVMPLLSGGSCLQVMRAVCADHQGFEDEHVIATILFGVLQGLSYIHQYGLIHRDVKADNVLISGEGDVMLADFGAAAQVDLVATAGGVLGGATTVRRCNSFVGTPCWMAPEVAACFVQGVHGHAVTGAAYAHVDQLFFSEESVSGVSRYPNASGDGPPCRESDDEKDVASSDLKSRGDNRVIPDSSKVATLIPRGSQIVSYNSRQSANKSSDMMNSPEGSRIYSNDWSRAETKQYEHTRQSLKTRITSLSCTS